MKRALTLTFVLIAATTCGRAWGADDADSQPAQENIQKMMRAWVEAARDKNTGPLEEMLADDFTHTGPGGQSMDKDTFVGHIKDGTFKIESLEHQDVKVRVYGNAAVVTGKIALKATWSDSDVSGDYAFTDTFIKHGDKWKQVAGQVTRIANQ